MTNKDRRPQGAIPDDDELIRMLKSGDSRQTDLALMVMAEHWEGMVWKIAAQEGSPERVRDTLNDALLILLEQVKGDHYRAEESSLSTWFYSIARNSWRKWKRDVQARNVLEHAVPPPASLHSEQREKEGENPKLETMVEALEKLQPECLQMLRKFWYEDQSLQSIAHELGITEDAVKKRHQRCKEKLRKIFEQLW
jgi:RNA polymerase sigma factor (sigma-70 family)